MDFVAAEARDNRFRVFFVVNFFLILLPVFKDKVVCFPEPLNSSAFAASHRMSVRDWFAARFLCKPNVS